MTTRRVAEFLGVSTEPQRRVIEGVGPNEFFTDGGVPIRLHDADFLGVVWRPAATLHLYFVYDSAWTPAEASATPVIELTFSPVEVSLWETDVDALGDNQWHGQVSAFDWDGADGFELSTFTLHLAFSASRMEARMLAAAPTSLT